MSRIIAGFILCFIAAAAAQGQSMQMLLEEADLVVAGRLALCDTGERYEAFALEGCEVIKGTAEPTFRIVRFKDLCCQAHHCAGQQKLLFLKRLDGAISGVGVPHPVYTVFSGKLGSICFDSEHGELLLGAARDLVSVSEEDRTGVLVRIFRQALEQDFEPLIFSGAHDMVALAGALEQLDSADEALILERFDAMASGSMTQARLLLLLGQLAPQGFEKRVEALVRSPGGIALLDPCAAILRHIRDPGTPERLVAGFPGLEAPRKKSVVYVLGRLGEGLGLSALEGLMGEHLHLLYPAFCDALRADRTDGAVRLLKEMAGMKYRDAALHALETLVWINTPAARDGLRWIAASDGIEETVKIRAAALLNGLSRYP